MGGEKPERIWVECHGIDGMLYQDGDGEVYLTMPERPSVPVIEYVRADLPPKVRALEWRVQSSDCQVADTPWGSTAVQNESHALAPNRWGWWMVGSGEDDCPSGYGDTIEAAKTAAQADYESRILAALDIAPAPHIVGAVVGASEGAKS